LIDFRYHLVSIVAVFLALAIGIVLGATALQGDTIDVLRSTNNSLQSHLNDTNAELNSAQQAVSADDSFLQIAEPKLLDGMLAGEKIVLVTEPGAPSDVIDGIQKAAASAGAAITGTVALQPKFNDLSGATRANLSQINSQLATFYGFGLAAAADDQTAYQQDAAQVISEAILQKSADAPGLSAADAGTLLKSYVDGGYLSYTGSPAGPTSASAGTTGGRATLAVIVTAPASAADGQSDPADEVLLAVATEFAAASAATLVAGPTMDQSLSASPVSVLRNSSASGLVSSVDNADTRVGQIAAIWALADQLQGGKPNSYGVSGANQVSPVPSPVPSATASVSDSPTPKTTGKVRKAVSTK
jgi:hypothetical protein